MENSAKTEMHLLLGVQFENNWILTKETQYHVEAIEIFADKMCEDYCCKVRKPR